MTPPSTAPHPLIQVGSGNHSLNNRFLLSVIAFQRSKQLSAGATARVARDGHKPTYVAVLEVLGNTVSWRQEPLPAVREITSP